MTVPAGSVGVGGVAGDLEAACSSLNWASLGGVADHRSGPVTLAGATATMMLTGVPLSARGVRRRVLRTTMPGANAVLGVVLTSRPRGPASRSSCSALGLRAARGRPGTWRFAGAARDDDGDRAAALWPGSPRSGSWLITSPLVHVVAGLLRGLHLEAGARQLRRGRRPPARRRRRERSSRPGRR